MQGENRWNWEKLVDSGDNDPTCLAYHSDRLAVSNPRRGITVWMFDRGMRFLPLYKFNKILSRCRSMAGT